MRRTDATSRPSPPKGQTVRGDVGRMYRGGSSRTAGPVPLDRLHARRSSVCVRGRVVRAGRRPIRQQGTERVITEGTLADRSGRAPFTAWRPFEVARGDTVRLSNAEVRERSDAATLCLTASTGVTILRTGESETPPTTRIADIAPGDRALAVRVALLESNRRVVGAPGEARDVRTGVCGDRSGRVSFIDWADRDVLQGGESVRLDNVYVLKYKGTPAVNLSRFSAIDRGVDSVSVERPPGVRPIRSLYETNGLFDVIVRGTVLELLDGSGLVARCPECNRVISAGRCRRHGTVDPRPDLRIKAIIDDGSAPATLVVGTQITARIYGADVDVAMEEARDGIRSGVVAEEIAARIVGRPMRVRGRASRTDGGLRITATDVDPIVGPPCERARSIRREVDR